MMNAELGELQESAGEGSVRFVRRYDVTPAELWPYLTEAEHLSAWITPGVEFEARVGGRIRFPWRQGAPMEGTVTVFDAPRQLAYVWREGEVESRVSLRLQPDGDGTLLLLEHTGLPLREARGFAAGWHSHLEWLTYALRGRAADFDEPTRFRELSTQYGYDMHDL